MEDFDIFMEKFEPIEHPNEEGFYMFETYGEELTLVEKHLKEKGPEYVWTAINGEKSKMWLVPGFHRVDRLGYFLTTKPWDEEERDYLY